MNYFLWAVQLTFLFPTTVLNYDGLDSKDNESSCFQDKSAHNENFITYNELVKETDSFRMSDVDTFNRILFDSQNFQVIYGARNHLFRLSLKGLQLLESSDWSSNQSTVLSCTIKGQRTEKCHNFVTVLEANGRRVYVCGTNAFKPLCTWRGLTSIGKIESWESGIGSSPYDPDQPVAASMTSDGSLFVGTSLDFLAHDAAFVRSRGGTGWLRTAKADSKWLAEPRFVSSFASGEFIYFFFNEIAVEALNCGKVMYPRIGRICKSDGGGSVILKDNWTTFLKARLNCSLPGRFPYYYNRLENIAYVPEEQIIFAVFTPNHESLSGSAVCAYKMTSVNDTFDGAFTFQRSPAAFWQSSTIRDNSHFKCHSTSSGHIERSRLANKYQLMEKSVEPLTEQPLFTIDSGRSKYIAVDPVMTRQSGLVYVVFTANSKGHIQKWTLLSRESFISTLHHRYSPKSCLIETLQSFPRNSTDEVLTMKFLRETNSLYLGTKYGALRIPVSRCNRYKTRHSCLVSRDPYCGWDTNILQCTVAPSGNPLSSSWIQHVIGCPSGSEIVDGEWSSWSDWSKCEQSGSKDQCLCRYRECNAPEPKRGGSECIGAKTEVSNCTVHGGWTLWSSWSQCSATCGVAVKTRRRTCSNPSPKHGGRICVGHESSEMYCHSLPPCPQYNHLPVDGGWSNWGNWSKCSSNCGRGTRKRKRLCNEPLPQFGGKDCASCDTETEECLGYKCSDLRAKSEWTPWMELPTTKTTYVYSTKSLQRRYRIKCAAKVDQNGELAVQAGPLSSEDQICSEDGCRSISQPHTKSGWSPWAEWSQCSVSCGGGLQRRYRSCDGLCSGKAIEERQCNIFKCDGTWSCWSTWSACPQCGSGTRERTRQCMESHNSFEVADGCLGSSLEVEPCLNSPCAETTIDAQKGLSKAAPTTNCVSVETFVGSCFACILLGVVFGAFGCYTLWLKNRKPKIPCSSHYISAKPNQYVTVPGVDWKDDSSHACEILNSPTSSLKKGMTAFRTAVTATLPLKEYDKATIKRSSHSSSHSTNHIRADLDSDCIFFS